MKHDLTEIQEEYDMKIDKLRKGQNKIQRSMTDFFSEKEQLYKLLYAKKSKYSRVKQDVLKHEQSVTAAVEKYFQKLRDELDQNLETVSNTIKSDIHVVSDLLSQAENKKQEVQELILLTDASKFFTDLKKYEKSVDIQMYYQKSNHGSIPNFVPGQITQSNIGMLEFETPSHSPHINLVVNKQYETELENVEYVCSSIDHSFWISSGIFGLVQKIKPDGTNLKILSGYDIQIYGLALTQLNSILISTGESRLKQISSNTGTLTDSVYNTSPFLPIALYITSDNQVLVGGVNKDYPKQGRRVVILLNQNGGHERVYEHDQHKKTIFTFPYRMTRTRNGNIHVVDEVSKDSIRVVVLGQGGDVINIYTGDTKINKDIPFLPRDIVTTPRDNVIVSVPGNDAFHILNNDGLLMTYYKTSVMDIIYPFSVAFTPTGQLYIGCSTPKGSTVKNAKIYEVTISGC
ncbi:uncharacterized protein LOC134714350 [Mytilus trossulus]|uniref:uncharacterized protein LOC134714350 n=1 Tax=Mytilus trossulus TaxID=6551 RepID=UPI003005FC4C